MACLGRHAKRYATVEGTQPAARAPRGSRSLPALSTGSMPVTYDLQRGTIDNSVIQQQIHQSEPTERSQAMQCQVSFSRATADDEGASHHAQMLQQLMPAEAIVIAEARVDRLARRAKSTGRCVADCCWGGTVPLCRPGTADILLLCSCTMLACCCCLRAAGGAAAARCICKAIDAASRPTGRTFGCMTCGIFCASQPAQLLWQPPNVTESALHAHDSIKLSTARTCSDDHSLETAFSAFVGDSELGRRCVWLS